jgi:DNA primase
MDVSTIIELIKEKKWGSYKISGKWINLSCPWAKEKHVHGTDTHASFGINIEKLYYNCFTCNTNGSLIKLFNGIVQPSTILLQLPIQEKDDIIYPEYFLKTLKRNYVHPYLDKRKVHADVRILFDFRYDSLHHRIGVPIRNFDKKLVGFVGRSLISMPKYFIYPWYGESNGHIWLGEHWIDLNEPVVLVEGLFDAARVYEVKSNVLASLGSQLPQNKLKRIRNAPYVFTLYDNDVAGDNARRKVSNYFGKNNIRHLRLPETIKDPGDASIEILQKLFQKELLW